MIMKAVHRLRQNTAAWPAELLHYDYDFIPSPKLRFHKSRRL